MKNLFLVILVLCAFAAVAVAGNAPGTLPYTMGAIKTQVQNVQGVAPYPAGSACTTATGTKGTIATVTTTGYLGMKWSATDADGAAVVVKRSINSNTAYMPESSGTLALHDGISSVKFSWYSSASAKTTTLCRELQ